MKIRLGILVLLLVAVSSLAEPIPAQAKKTVAFVYFTDDPTNSSPDGTGFFVSVTNTNTIFGYFVTAKHVLRPPPRNEWLPSVYIRINRRDGTSDKKVMPLFVDGASKNVFTNQDPTVDIAVIPFLPQPVTNYDFNTLPIELIPSEEDFKTLDIREGSDVFFVGMFVRHLGEKQNTPITRFGKVALMTDEKIDWATGKTHLYLMEANSYPGNSGSPAFFQIGMERAGGLYLNTTVKLAGIMSGYFPDVQPLQTVSTSTNQYVTPNMGIAAVVPSYELKEILFSNELKAARGEQ
jgi:hypothetical protein